MPRFESDSLGKVEIPEKAYWGAQTQRSLQNFAIGDAVFPRVFIKNYALLKKACALANEKTGALDSDKASWIAQACDEIIDGALEGNFPLKVWQTGSGTQTNMNLNEVIANRASELGGGKKGSALVHPNDHVNRSQSSNDTFPTVMQMSAVEAFEETRESMESLIAALEVKERDFKDLVKIGRTHLMDAVPMTVGQEFSAWAGQLKSAWAHAEVTAELVYELPIGGTAIGTGLNATEEFVEEVVANIRSLTAKDFFSAENKFVKIAAHDDLAALHAALKGAAMVLMKVANDIRLLGSGPRAGLFELSLPANEPGSSIMPGKVNPTQCEAMTMVCAQVIGNDTAIAFGASHGQFQLNAYKPLIIHNLLTSLRLLTDACASFDKNCVQGIQVNEERLAFYLGRSLMIVTALTPVIGYEKSSKVAQAAFAKGTTIREEVLEAGLLEAEEFDRLIDLGKMV